MYYKARVKIGSKLSEHNTNVLYLDKDNYHPDVEKLIFQKIANCFYKSVASDGYYVVPDEYMEPVETFLIWFCRNDGMLEKSDSYRDVFYDYDDALDLCRKLNEKHTTIIYFPQKHKI
jgi:hypothetical protein